MAGRFFRPRTVQPPEQHMDEPTQLGEPTRLDEPVRRTRSLTARIGAWICFASGLLAPLAAPAADSGDSSAFGFTAAQLGQQRSLEERFDGALDAHELRAWLQRLSSEPNHVGSPHDKANAEFVRELFTRWGWEAQIEVFEVLYPTLR